MHNSIVLLRPPMVVPRWAHASSKCPPLGLAYIAAALEKAGFGVRAVDALGDDPFKCIVLENPNFLTYGLSTPEIVERVGSCSVVGMSLMFSHDWPIAKSIIQAVHKANPAATIICGGEHVTAVPDFCLDDCPEIDYCVLGEGEETLVDLMRALNGAKPVEDVAGIAYRNAEGSVAHTKKRARIGALGDIAWPAWDYFPLENYLANDLGYGVNPGRTVPICASRGCPFECTFCSNPLMWTTKWQARPVDDVIDEMQHGIDKYGAQNFDFYDLTTIVRKDWIKEFCQKVIDRKWNITWQMPAGTRSEALDAEVLHLMYLSGQRNLTYAPESGSAATLKAIKKKIDLGRMKQSIAAAIKEGMNVKLNIIMGFPHETRKEIFETLGFLKDVALLGVHDVYVACFSPYPGSELFDQLYASGKVRELNQGGKMRAMDDEYFLMLTSYSDMRYSYSYSPHVSNAMLTFYRLGGMLMFYAISYAVHPGRLVTTVKNVIQGKEESRLDMALGQLKGRIFGKKLTLRDAQKTT